MRQSEILKCRLCDRPGKEWTPWWGTPFTDYLCDRHALIQTWTSPGNYIHGLFLLLILAGLGKLIWMFVSWILSL